MNQLSLGVAKLQGFTELNQTKRNINRLQLVLLQSARNAAQILNLAQNVRQARHHLLGGKGDKIARFA